MPPNGGKVTFMQGARILGAGTLRDGVARFTTSKLDFGGHAVSAVYAGDAEFEGTRVDDASAVEIHTVH